MPRFYVNENFQFRGQINRAGMILTTSDDDVKVEIAKGLHPKTKRPMSGLLSHCSPADDKTAALLADVEGAVKEVVEQEEELTDDESELTAARQEMDALGAAYDRRWGLPRMQNELIKARKLRG